MPITIHKGINCENKKQYAQICGNGPFTKAQLAELATVCDLVFDEDYNHIDIEKLSDYDSIESICFCIWGKFNQPIRKYPSNLKNVYFGNKFNQSIDSLPNGTLKVILGNKFNMPINQMVGTIIELDMGRCINYSHSIANISISISTLIIGFAIHNCDIWPARLESLVFSSECQLGEDVQFNNLPPTVKHITMPETSNITIIDNETIESLEFYNDFTPVTLITAKKLKKFKCHFLHHETSELTLIPEWVETFEFNCYQDPNNRYEHICILKFPANLLHVKAIRYYPLLDNLPPNIKTIYVSYDYQFTDELAELYPNAIITVEPTPTPCDDSDSGDESLFESGSVE